MKLLLLIPYLAPVYGGTAQVVPALAAALANTGITVDVVTTAAAGSTVLSVPLNDWQHQDGYRVRYCRSWHRRDFVWSGSLLRWLLAHGQDYDLVHTHTLFAPVVAAAHWICRWRRVPYVMTPHGMLDPWALGQKAGKKQRYMTWVERPALAHAAAIHVLSRREAEQVAALQLPTPVATIPNGVTLPPPVSPDLFLDERPHLRSLQRLLYLGRIDPKKGLDQLVTALASLHRDRPQLHLILAGPDALGYRDALQRQARTLGCESALTFTGLLTGDRKWAALQAADLFVYPSYSEGFSMAILEAMAVGLPCVITPGCNFPEAAIANAAITVDPDPPALAAALRQLIQDPDGAKALGDRARHLVQTDYTWSHRAQQLHQLYHDLVGDPPAATAD
jgi:glycosyltransferase involved in cell wall biosynthesis